MSILLHVKNFITMIDIVFDKIVLYIFFKKLFQLSNEVRNSKTIERLQDDILECL